MLVDMRFLIAVVGEGRTRDATYCAVNLYCARSAHYFLSHFISTLVLMTPKVVQAPQQQREECMPFVSSRSLATCP